VLRCVSALRIWDGRTEGEEAQAVLAVMEVEAVLVPTALVLTARLILVVSASVMGIAAVSPVLIRIPGTVEAVATSEKPRFRTT
jgi:hypothetical protein